jgi:hypothetical protein
MNAGEIVSETAISLHELSFVDEGEQVVVGRLDTSEFVVLPSDGAQLLARLAEGMSPTRAAEWYAETYAEPVDIDDFIEAITDLGFVRGEAEPEVVAPKLRLAGAGRVLFSPVTAALYLALLVFWAVLIARHADLRPASHQLFFSSSLVLVQLGVTVGQIPLLLLHEGAHVLAGQRLGLASSLNVSNRLTYVVFETKLNGLLSVPRRRRYLAFLAGLMVDLAVLALLDTTAQVTREQGGGLSIVGAIALSLGFTVVMRMAWQFQLYLRTDLYYVFSTALSCLDLHAASKALLANRLWRLLDRPDRLVDESQWTDHDRRVGRWYGPFLLVGVLVTILILIFATAPIIGQYFASIWRHLASGQINGHFWDAVFSLAFNLGQLVLLYWLARRKRRQEARRAPKLLLEQGV